MPSEYTLPMERHRGELTRILNLLQGHPRGLTKTDIARRTGGNRRSVARGLDVLVTSGTVEERVIGPGKVYFLSSCCPMPATLNLSSDYIIMLDEEGRIVHANDGILSFEGRTREEVLGRSPGEVPLIVLRDPEIRNWISGGAPEREVSTEVDVKKGERMYHFRATLVGSPPGEGGWDMTVILQDITGELRYPEPYPGARPPGSTGRPESGNSL